MRDIPALAVEGDRGQPISRGCANYRKAEESSPPRATISSRARGERGGGAELAEGQWRRTTNPTPFRSLAPPLLRVSRSAVSTGTRTAASGLCYRTQRVHGKVL